MSDEEVKDAEALAKLLSKPISETDVAKSAEQRADPATEAKLSLVKACEGVITAVKAVMVHEPDHVMQHQLHSLISELEWCSREYGGEK